MIVGIVAGLVVLSWVVVGILKSTHYSQWRTHQSHIKRRLDLLTLDIVPFNCRLHCGRHAVTECGACFECCSYCRSKEASDPTVQRAWIKREQQRQIKEMEQENGL
jgi:hypothetical protein